ncbi:hypothetical protein [Dyella sp.]|uniref:hypothetical protein n=1 Tax=Dyella sp. TaxID=1869338 RepID=UPI002ED3B747
MKSQDVKQAKQSGSPASQQGGRGGAVQKKVGDTPRQAKEAAHIAQLKGTDKGKAKAAPKKGKAK